ncbi:hypothetical protein C8J57DRAFT_1716483 [Mycena rebaudengoi]|nr:hypothetical protein C8J57DRAFT_1736590 [Mycena rebaudengoi]KAJ7270311.1 hypothetical protein C8J57DRAFT_1716483 [Mycena rebaudengoi]
MHGHLGSPASPCAAQPPLRPAAMPSALSPPPHKCTPPTAENRPSRLRAAWRSSPALPPPLSFCSAYSVLWTSLAARRAAVPRSRGCTAAARISLQRRPDARTYIASARRLRGGLVCGLCGRTGPRVCLAARPTAAQHRIPEALALALTPRWAPRAH